MISTPVDKTKKNSHFIEINIPAYTKNISNLSLNTGWAYHISYTEAFSLSSDSTPIQQKKIFEKEPEKYQKRKASSWIFGNCLWRSGGSVSNLKNQNFEFSLLRMKRFLLNKKSLLDQPKN